VGGEVVSRERPLSSVDTVVRVGPIEIGGGRPFALIAGPCVIEGRDSALRHARAIRDIAERLNVPFIYKSSFDKANRTSVESFRGLGRDEGLAILVEVRREFGVPVLTDVHERDDVPAVAAAVDILQTPAFLCRQTDFLQAVARGGKPVNVKKGQFLSPWEMGAVVAKVTAAGNRQVLVTERGASFGYNNLVTDFRSLVVLAEIGCPVVFDATHSVQLPGGRGSASGGQREFVAPLARAAVAVGVDAVFMEVHEDPDRAPSDGPNSVRLSDLEGLLQDLIALDRVRKARRRGSA
jgi:2-dehydro-3-deoxyphosphooctonate aldolase (KDO 8-P synthase)